MPKTLASSLFLLALCACAPEGTLHIHLASDSSGYKLHSKAHVRAGVARFECRASSSGRCHYTLYPKDCAGPDCTQAPMRRFALARGATLQLSGVDDFRLCVSVDAVLQDAGCEAAKAPAKG